jgi:chaperone modulatory protein CbpM
MPSIRARPDEGGVDMTERFTEDEIVATVTRLTRRQLVQFIEGDLVRPERSGGGTSFAASTSRGSSFCAICRRTSIWTRRPLGIVISLIDQLHATRQELAAVAHAMDALPTDMQARLAAELKRG